MKKILFSILFLICAVTSFAQAPQNRSSSAVTAVDSRLRASLNFGLPITRDSTLNGGLDSLGSMIYDKVHLVVWLRDTIPSGGHYWKNMFAAGSGLTSVGISSSDLSVSGSPLTSNGTITLNINNGAVTYLKFQQLPATSLFGNPNAFTATGQAISVGYGLKLDPATLSIILDTTVVIDTIYAVNGLSAYGNGHDSIGLGGILLKSTTVDVSNFPLIINDTNKHSSGSIATNFTVNSFGVYTNNSVSHTAMVVTNNHINATSNLTGISLSVSGGNPLTDVGMLISSNGLGLQVSGNSPTSTTTGIVTSISGTGTSPFYAQIAAQDSTSVIPGLLIRRSKSSSSINTIPGSGGSIEFYQAQGNVFPTGGDAHMHSIQSIMTDTTFSSVKSELQIWGQAGNLFQQQLTLKSTGALQLNRYSALVTSSDTTTYKPTAMDASGNLIKMASWFGSGGGGGGGNGVGRDTVQAYASGTTLTQNASTNYIQLNPASVQGTLTITTLGSAGTWHTSNDLYIVAGGTVTSTNPVITTLSVVAGSGLTLVQAVTPTTINAGEPIHYHRIGNFLYRIN